MIWAIKIISARKHFQQTKDSKKPINSREKLETRKLSHFITFITSFYKLY